MKAIKALLLKDFYTALSTLRFLFLICFIPAVLSLGKPSFAWGYVVGISTIFGIFIPITTLAYDKLCGFSGYALTLPCTPRDQVLSKYLLGYMSAAVGALMELVFSLFCYVYDPNMGISLGTLFVIPLGLMMISCIVLAIHLPIFYRFGVEKGKLLLFATTFLLSTLGASFSKSMDFSLFTNVLSQHLSLCLILSLLLCGLCQWISMPLSVRFFLKTIRT